MENLEELFENNPCNQNGEEDDIDTIDESEEFEDDNEASDELDNTEVDSEDADDEESEIIDNSEQFMALQESVNEMQEAIGNIQFNVSMLVQNQASAADVAAMRRENEAFRADSNMKLMRKYGIDAMIKTCQAVCDKLYQISHSAADDPKTAGEKSAYDWVLKRMERQLKQLGIRMQRSEVGTEIDESVMVVYGTEGEFVDEEETMVETDDETLKGTVKESVCPAFFWTIPSLIGDVREWCMEPEKVCVYK